MVGKPTGFFGFICEHPSTRPKLVSSTAASNAPPQFGSLSVDIQSASVGSKFLSSQEMASHLAPPLALLKKEHIS